MSGRSRVGTHWRRPATHVYDYNYKMGEHYYSPQLNYVDVRGRRGSPPKAKTFAERFADNPVYGDYGPPKWRTAATGLAFGYPRRPSLGDDLGFGTGRRPVNDEDSVFGRRRQPLNDEDLGFRRRPQNDEDFGIRRKPFDEEEFFRRKPLDDDEDMRFNARGDDEIPRRPRFDFGEKLLDAVGAHGRRGQSEFRAGPTTPRSARVQIEDPFEEEFFSRRPKASNPRTADADMREDPFKLRNAKAFGMMDDEDDEYSHDADSVMNRIRAKLRAKREKEEASNPPAATKVANDLSDEFGPSRLDQLRSKAKARMAEMDDDFSEFSIKPRRTAGKDTLDNLSSKYGVDFDSGTGGGSRSIHIKKRTVRTTVDD